jgi:hypothetical protein
MDMEFLTGMNIVLTLMNIGMIVYINTAGICTRKDKRVYEVTTGDESHMEEDGGTYFS